jgi:ATP-binding cassette subfamily C protein
MFETVRKLLGLLTPRQRRRWLAMAPLLILTSAVETVATGLVFLLIRVTSDPSHALRVRPLAKVMELLPSSGPGPTGHTLVLASGAFVAAFFVLRSLLLLLVRHVESRAIAHTIAGLSTRVFESYLAAPFAAHLRLNPSDLTYDATTAVDRSVEHGMGALVGIVTEVLVSLGLAIFLLVMAPVVTLATATTLALLAGTAVRLTKRSSRRWGRMREDLGRQAQKDVHQSLGGIREIKVLGRERAFLESFVQTTHTLARGRRRHHTMMAIPRLSIETIFVSCVLLAMALAQSHGDAGGGVLPLLGLYAYAGFRLIPAANRMIFQVDMLRGAGRAVTRLHAHLGQLDGAARLSGEAPAGAPALAFQDAIVLEGVGFRYEGADTPVLTDVNATIRRGESVAIVGATGSGKSTLADLILGLLDPTVGRITVDGVDIREARRSWQRRIGYVPQAAFLFDDSIRRNVALGVPPDQIDDDRVREALRLAQLADFVAGLPGGLETQVGDRGLRLSGGQRQRVAIARALYGEPELLVFDEATAALDNQTEREVTRAVESLRGRKTVLVIAHRLSTVRRCDALLFLRDGRVHATGTFERLLQESPEFRAMAAVAADAGGPAEPAGP